MSSEHPHKLGRMVAGTKLALESFLEEFAGFGPRQARKQSRKGMVSVDYGAEASKPLREPDFGRNGMRRVSEN